MLAALRRPADRMRGVEFCDGCGQVCTAAGRTEARRDRVRTALLSQFPVPR
jgi:hypothetical protein